jgi:hypothetical protein
MPAKSKALEIAGFPVERVSAGRHSLGQVVIDENVTVMFQLNDSGSPSPFPDAGCLSCKISKISQCAALVCPDIKAKDPSASCSDAIRECMDLACRGSCSGGGLGGGILVLA